MPLSAYRMEMSEIEHGVSHPDGVAYSFSPDNLLMYEEHLRRIDDPSLKVRCGPVKQVTIDQALATRIFNSGNLLSLVEQPEGDLGLFESRRPSRRPTVGPKHRFYKS